MAAVKSDMIGVRVKMSPLGTARSPSLAGKEGVVIGGSRYSSSFRVQFDGYKSPTLLHRDYLEPIPPDYDHGKRGRK